MPVDEIQNDEGGPEVRSFRRLKADRALLGTEEAEGPLPRLTPEEHGLRLAQAGWLAPEIRAMARGPQGEAVERRFRDFEDWWLWKRRFARPEGEEGEGRLAAWRLLRLWASGEVDPDDEAGALRLLQDFLREDPARGASFALRAAAGLWEGLRARFG